MKRLSQTILILSIALFSCKKSTTQPTPIDPTPIVPTTPTNTATTHQIIFSWVDIEYTSALLLLNNDTLICDGYNYKTKTIIYSQSPYLFIGKTGDVVTLVDHRTITKSSLRIDTTIVYAFFQNDYNSVITNVNDSTRIYGYRTTLN